MPDDFNHAIIEEFRANNGRVGGPFADARLLLLTTTGRRTGKPHTVPVGYLHDNGGRTLVIASAAGAVDHPQWYYNLLARPRVTVETGVFSYTADAEVLAGAERDEVFARAVEADPGWGEYQEKTSRVIPVVALHPVERVPDDAPWGESLKAVHDLFRRELALIRTEVAGSGPRLGAQLRINCLTVCAGLHHHHTAEDIEMFPLVERSRPELAPTVARLRREHEAIARLIDELRELISTGTADRETVLPEVDRLIAEIEAHLDYEERQLIPMLNRMG